MIKTMVILVALSIAAVNVLAQTGRKQQSGRRVHQTSAIRIAPPTTYLKEGLTTEQVVRVLGEPMEVSERDEHGRKITTLQFRRGANRVLIAEFVNDALVSSTTETRETLIANNS